MLKKSIIAVSLLLICITASPAQKSRDTHKLSLPDRNWVLEVKLAGFLVTRNAVSRDGRAARIDARIESEGYLLTVMMAVADEEGVGTSKDLHKLAADRLQNRRLKEKASN